jgi:hypothetical protein
MRCPDPLPGARFRLSGEAAPTIATDPTDAARVYVAWSSCTPTSQADVFLSRSSDGGATWSPTPVRVNDDGANNPRDQFFPAITVDDQGVVRAMWGDDRLDTVNPGGHNYDIFAAASTDHGASFGANVRMTTQSSNPDIDNGGTFIGDYFGMAPCGTAVWGDTRNGNQDIFAAGLDENGDGIVDDCVTGPAANTAVPTIKGTAIVGATLNGSPGGWKGFPLPAFARRWRRCDTGGGNCVDITGATANSYTLVGSDAGSTIRLRVSGTNPLGAAAADSPQTAVVLDVPGAPGGVSASAGNASATVTWTAPADNGGSAITGYAITPYIGATAHPSVAVGAVTSATLPGLSNGTTYTFTVAAKNAVGTGTTSAVSNAVTPATVPGAPGGVSANAGNASATITWTAPADDGGSAITGYAVTPHIGATAQPSVAVGAVTSATLSGLGNGTTYTFTVAAKNAVGTGAASKASNAVVPKAPPPPVRCAVPNVKGKPLARAKRKITAGHCKTGKVTTAKSKTVKKGNVIAQKPKPGTKLARGAKVNLTVSRGRRGR